MQQPPGTPAPPAGRRLQDMVGICSREIQHSCRVVRPGNDALTSARSAPVRSASRTHGTPRISVAATTAPIPRLSGLTRGEMSDMVMRSVASAQASCAHAGLHERRRSRARRERSLQSYSHAEPSKPDCSPEIGVHAQVERVLMWLLALQVKAQHLEHALLVLQQHVLRQVVVLGHQEASAGFRSLRRRRTGGRRSPFRALRLRGMPIVLHLPKGPRASELEDSSYACRT